MRRFSPLSFEDFKTLLLPCFLPWLDSNMQPSDLQIKALYIGLQNQVTNSPQKSTPHIPPAVTYPSHHTNHTCFISVIELAFYIQVALALDLFRGIRSFGHFCLVCHPGDQLPFWLFEQVLKESPQLLFFELWQMKIPIILFFFTHLTQILTKIIFKPKIEKCCMRKSTQWRKK